ncbi:MAG: IS30 family transposase, partial [Candidatus Komeilibacteria bacterium CG11_big_fil_rev_8_21_14_0_20_36_20]
MKKYTRLSFGDREEISKGIWAEETFTQIAKRIDRPSSAISREVWSNVKKKKRSYSAEKAQERANKIKKMGRRPKKLDEDQRIKCYVYEKLKMEWSPDEIAKRIKLDYPQDNTMRISHETIYQHIYCLPRGELRKELSKALRQERKMRQPRKYAHYRKQRIQDLISISERPEEVKDRIIPGHWEGDLIVGKNHKSAIGTLVERTTRLTLIVPLKEKGALSVSKAFAKEFKKIPRQFKKTLTYDRGTEMSQHKLFTKESKIQVYFADPYSPWQRGTNENTNGLIRQYFPKGTNFSDVSLSKIKEVEKRLNSRPRKVLKY